MKRPGEGTGTVALWVEADDCTNALVGYYASEFAARRHMVILIKEAPAFGARKFWLEQDGRRWRLR